MSEVLVVIAVTAGAFIGTNLDNLLLLTAMYSRYERHAVMVTAGYFAGMILIGVIALAIGEVGEFIPLTYLGLLGVIPMMMGVLGLFKLFRNTHAGEPKVVVSSGGSLTVFLALISTQLSNGADTIITFSALLADSSDVADYLVAPTFLAMIGVFNAVAWYALKHRTLSKVVSRYGQYVTPFILMLVGFYILSNTASDLVPG
jgi:cadmium resistance protein CadD (predicted permease)